MTASDGEFAEAACTCGSGSVRRPDGADGTDGTAERACYLFGGTAERGCCLFDGTRSVPSTYGAAHGVCLLLAVFEELDEVGEVLWGELFVEAGGHDGDFAGEEFFDLLAGEADFLVGGEGEDDFDRGVGFDVAA